MAIFAPTDQPIALPLVPPLPHANNATDVARTDVAANSQKGFFCGSKHTDWELLAVKLGFLSVGMAYQDPRNQETTLHFCGVVSLGH